MRRDGGQTGSAVGGRRSRHSQGVSDRADCVPVTFRRSAVSPVGWGGDGRPRSRFRTASGASSKRSMHGSKSAPRYSGVLDGTRTTTLWQGSCPSLSMRRLPSSEMHSTRKGTASRAWSRNIQAVMAQAFLIQLERLSGYHNQRCPVHRVFWAERKGRAARALHDHGRKGAGRRPSGTRQRYHWEGI